jgi:hypothetical protein
MKPPEHEYGARYEQPQYGNFAQGYGTHFPSEEEPGPQRICQQLCGEQPKGSGCVPESIHPS